MTYFQKIRCVFFFLYIIYIPKKKTKQEFITESNILHNNKYSYDNILYINNKTKVEIVCSIHGVFKQRSNDHLSNKGCPKCGKINSSNRQRNDKNFFIENANKKHNSKYDYKLVKYHNNKTKVEIICPEHGKFSIRPYSHLNGQTCKYCSRVIYIHDDFIKKANEIHNNKYTYVGKYVDMSSKLEIICPEHGSFSIRPKDHIHLKQGCSKCSSSKGETKILKVLEKYNINYETQKIFEGLRSDKNVYLKYDFYLSEYNMCIEFDGDQHYRPIKYFGGYTYFIKQKIHDNKKDKYCEENNIYLLRIPYYEFNNIEEILLNNFF